MSRIQQILDKAQREGRLARTADIGSDARLEPRQAPPAGTPGPRAVHAPTHPPVLARAVPDRASTQDTRDESGAPHPTDPLSVRPAVPGPLVAPARVAPRVVPHPLVVAASLPHSPVAEQYRALRTRITQVEQGRSLRTLMVTSPLAGDGKTVTSLNLAFTMAREVHRRVLLIDADLRSGSLHRLLGLPASPGLADVLAGEVALDAALIAVPEWRLTVLTAGSQFDNSTELLGSTEMRRLLDAVRTQFDRVVIDTPPAAPLADVGVVAPLVDGVIVVVRAGRTPKPAIERTLAGIDPERLLGLVLNDVEGTQPSYGSAATFSAGGAPSARRPGTDAGVGSPA